MLRCHRGCQEGAALAGKARPLAKQQATWLGLQRASPGKLFMAINLDRWLWLEHVCCCITPQPLQQTQWQPTLNRCCKDM